jgi:Tat protein translocase TatB subunit
MLPHRVAIVFNVGPEKFALIALVAMVVLGPEKLPGAARTFGQFLHQFRQVQANLRAEVENAMRIPDHEPPAGPDAGE